MKCAGTLRRRVHTNEELRGASRAACLRHRRRDPESEVYCREGVEPHVHQHGSQKALCATRRRAPTKGAGTNKISL